jgi:hypothetical protein
MGCAILRGNSPLVFGKTVMPATYSDQDLAALVGAPMMVGLTVAMADLGIVSTAIEAAALSKEMATAAQKYPNNSIIQAVFSEEAIKSGKVKPEKPEIKPEEVESGAVVDKAIASIQAAVAAAQGKASDVEIAEYKSFIYACGEAVAQAAGDGLFGSGEKVSDKEKAVLAKLKAALA